MTVLPFSEFLAGVSRSVVHLEMRDTYSPSDPEFVAWQRGEPFEDQPRIERWHRLIGGAVDRGVEVRRARVISEPMSDYVRFEHAGTSTLNVGAGEQVRWLPRSRTLDLGLPGLDFWLADDAVLRVAHFAGDGEIVSHEVVAEAAIVKHCADAFEAVWDRAIPHEDYIPQT